jgi:hypothetical protein
MPPSSLWLYVKYTLLYDQRALIKLALKKGNMTSYVQIHVLNGRGRLFLFGDWTNSPQDRFLATFDEDNFLSFFKRFQINYWYI